jgi:D-aspartate ligase
MSPPQPEPNPALILGMGANGLGVARALGRHGVPILCFGTDPEAPILKCKYVSSRILAHSESNRDEILRLLLEEARKWSKKCVLIPTSDDYLEMICDQWEHLQEAFIMPLAGPSKIMGIVNKRSQYENAYANCIPIPKTIFPKDLDDLRTKALELRYPLIVKPYYSNTWQRTKKIKGFMVKDRSELLENVAILDESDLVLVQEYVPGPNNDIVSVAGCVRKNGSMSRMVAWRKERQFPIDVGVGCFARTIEDQEALELAERTVRSLGYVGVFEIELKRDPRDGQYKLIEMNARSWLQNALAERAGLNLIMISYLDALGAESEFQGMPSSGIRWWDAYSDTIAFFQLRQVGDLSTSHWIRSIIGCESFAFLSIDDPMPFLAKWKWGANLPLVMILALKSRKIIRKSSQPSPEPASDNH